MRCGSTLLIPYPGTPSALSHLWIILSEPDPLCVIVSLTSLRGNKDQTVLLGYKDHRFIEHETIAFYAYAEIQDVRNLQAKVDGGTAKPHDPCTPEMLKLLQAGVHASPYCAKKIQRFCKERGVK